jgi:hypothetical protein
MHKKRTHKIWFSRSSGLGVLLRSVPYSTWPIRLDLTRPRPANGIFHTTETNLRQQSEH